jgi:hypothetical protein
MVGKTSEKITKRGFLIGKEELHPTNSFKNIKNKPQF